MKFYLIYLELFITPGPAGSHTLLSPGDCSVFRWLLRWLTHFLLCPAVTQARRDTWFWYIVRSISLHGRGEVRWRRSRSSSRRRSRSSNCQNIFIDYHIKGSEEVELCLGKAIGKTKNSGDGSLHPSWLLTVYRISPLFTPYTALSPGGGKDKTNT